MRHRPAGGAARRRAARLSGGRRPLTLDAPKCLTEVGGRPILERLVENLRVQGITRLVVVTGYMEHCIVEFLRHNAADMQVEYIFNPSVLELAEIKNDLISNITHEFKTPLATINVALEGIQRFNLENDSEKSKKYAEMSRAEVEKLTVMVEKLLETATLDSDSLHLNLVEINLVNLLEKAATIDVDMLQGKSISLNTNLEECILKVDRFHFENAINNILDNAIKYGGDRIEIDINNNHSEVVISIKDDGVQLTKQQSLQIFEKFYRVPKGNTHNVKGFGIGLYYTKNIIEKHGGSVHVDIKNGAEFIIRIPNQSKIN